MTVLINKLSRLMGIAAGAVLLAMTLLTVADVGLRYFFKRPILGTTEFTESLMVCLAFFAMAWGATQGVHLKVDLVVSKFSRRWQAIIDSLTTLPSLLMIALIAWRNWLEGDVVKELELVSSLVGIPVYPFYYVISISSAILCLVMTIQLIEKLKRVVQ